VPVETRSGGEAEHRKYARAATPICALAAATRRFAAATSGDVSSTVDAAGIDRRRCGIGWQGIRIEVETGRVLAYQHGRCVLVGRVRGQCRPPVSAPSQLCLRLIDIGQTAAAPPRYKRVRQLQRPRIVLDVFSSILARRPGSSSV